VARIGDRDPRQNFDSQFNFVAILDLYLLSRRKVSHHSPFLFARTDGSLPRRSWFLSWLHLFAPTVSSHGLRAGGATFLASRGVPDEVIMRLGRWSSESWQLYLREHPALLAAANRNDLGPRV
jgi:integrase